MTAPHPLEHHFDRYVSRVTSQAHDALIGAERLDEDQIDALETSVGTNT